MYRKINLTPEKIKQVILLYETGTSVLKIEKKLQISEATIYRILKANNVDRTPLNQINRKYQIKEDFFNEIDTEAKAYFLGLLFADGTNDGYSRIAISLQSEDAYILESLKNLISPDSKVKNYPSRCKNCKPQTFLYLYSKNLSKSLSALGCIQNKSKSMNMPSIPKHMLHHFIRGYFDGDGSVGFREYPSRVFTVNFTSCVDFLTQLKINLENLGFYVSKIRMDKRNSYTASFGISKYENILKFYRWLYKDATYFLTRKKNKFDKIETWKTKKIKYKI
jgi:hypothetical protein